MLPGSLHSPFTSDSASLHDVEGRLVTGSRSAPSTGQQQHLVLHLDSLRRLIADTVHVLDLVRTG